LQAAMLGEKTVDKAVADAAQEWNSSRWWPSSTRTL
jgi:putative chitobiose transport system substrate-binding protein